MSTPAPYVYTYCLGGITFQVKSDLKLSDFLLDKFRHFVPSSRQLDVRCRIRGVDLSAAGTSNDDPWLTEALIRWLPRDGLPHPWPLLHLPEVKIVLRAGLAHADAVQVELRATSIVITNLARQRTDIFYQRDSQHFTQHTRHVDSGMILPFLPAFDAALLHGSGVVCHDMGGLFLAPDGGGKTTFARLVRPADEVISDDQNLVRKVDGRFCVSALPWCRILGSTGPHPLGGLFFLEKAAAFDLIPLNPVDALEHVVLDPQNASGPLPRAFRLRAAQLRVELFRQIPAFRLRFSKDYVDWEAVSAAMHAPIYRRSTT